MPKLPVSLVFFLITGVVMLLQMVPIIGVVMMFALAMLWSVALINAGMIGIGVEAVIGRVPRLWLIVPLAFYGGYFLWAWQDRQEFAQLSASYAASNAKIAVPFDPDGQALVFEGNGHDGSFFVQNYGLPVAFSRNPNHPEGFRSTRIVGNAVCRKLRDTPAISAAGIYPTWFHDGDAIGSRVFEKRFCNLGMPERPTQPFVNVAHVEDRIRVSTLPVTRITTTVSTPDGRRFRLLGGVAAPLKWLPMPAMGCGLNSGAPSWDCGFSFLRDGFTPIVPGDTRYSRDSVVLANALGLQRVPLADRKGGDVALVRAKMAEVEAAMLTRQLAALDRMIADPLAKDPQWDLGVVGNRSEVLLSRADAIMTGLERAAAAEGPVAGRTRDSGRILAGLIARLPRERFVEFGPRLFALYRDHALTPLSDDGTRNLSRDKHWLWDSEMLLRRLGDLGGAALPVLIDPRGSTPNVNGAGIEGLCRIGAPARTAAAPVLLQRWAADTNRVSRDERRALYVAMRRIGITPPPIVESDDDRKRRERAYSAFGGILAKQRAPMEILQADWGDVTPASPPRVCAVSAEEQARREEKRSGTRTTNLD